MDPARVVKQDQIHTHTPHTHQAEAVGEAGGYTVAWRLIFVFWLNNNNDQIVEN